MRYWFSVHLPLLPLESVRPHWCEPAPFAVVEKGKVISVSRKAYITGVRVGMRPGGVSAVSPSTTILERDLQREEITLNSVALTLLQYTPEVTHADDFSILLDVTASLRLFRGRAANPSVSVRRPALQAKGDASSRQGPSDQFQPLGNSDFVSPQAFRCKWFKRGPTSAENRAGFDPHCPGSRRLDKPRLGAGAAASQHSSRGSQRA